MKYILYILLNLIIIYHKFDLNILEHVKKKKGNPGQSSVGCTTHCCFLRFLTLLTQQELKVTQHLGSTQTLSHLHYSGWLQ